LRGPLQVVCPLGDLRQFGACSSVVLQRWNWSVIPFSQLLNSWCVF
jgi:hypothetical protein